jgi:GTPase SAR1 family protein
LESRIKVNENWQKELQCQAFIDEGYVSLLIYLTGSVRHKYQENSKKCDVKVFVRSLESKPVRPLATCRSSKPEDVKLVTKWKLDDDLMACKYWISFCGCLVPGTVRTNTLDSKDEDMFEELEVPKENAKEISSAWKDKVKSMFSGPTDRRRSKMRSSFTEQAFDIKELSNATNSNSNALSLLIIGTVNSGKSTIFEQFCRSSDLWSEEEWLKNRNTITPIIRQNILDAVDYLLKKNKSLRKEKIFSLSDESKKIAKKLEETNLKESSLTPQIAGMIRILWSDPGFRVTFERYPPPYLASDCVESFLDDIDTIADQDYVPAEEDALRAYSKTSGVVKHGFCRKSFNLDLIDVGGRLEERANWGNAIQQASAIMFVCALDEYDQMTWEDNKRNALQDSIRVFSEIFSNNTDLEKIPLFLIFNKKDEFRRKLNKIPLEKHFADWNPRNTKGNLVEEAQNFIAEKFLVAVPQKPSLITQFTNARDSKAMKKMVNEVVDEIERVTVKYEVNLVSPAALHGKKSRRSLFLGTAN